MNSKSAAIKIQKDLGILLCLSSEKRKLKFCWTYILRNVTMIYRKCHFLCSDVEAASSDGFTE